jgi:hypothetical protein
MRQRGMTAGVARTSPEICDATESRACEAAKKSGKKLDADWSSVGAQCSSACVLALMGARQRLVPPGSYIAIHAPRMVLCGLTDGTILNLKDPRCIQIEAEQKKRTSRYVRDMGGDPELVEAAYRTPFEMARQLNRDEIRRFGIDRSELGESRWMVSPEDSGLLMVQFVVDANKGDSADRVSAITIGCRYSSSLVFTYIRPISSEDVHVTAVFGERRYAFPTTGTSMPVRQIDPDKWFERRELWLSTESADASKLKIETKIVGRSADASTTAIDISSNGFEHSWKRMAASCGWKS